MDYLGPFQADKCQSCGECFHQCPVLQLPIASAKDEVARLARGEDTRRVLRECTSCFDCNWICPQHANPAQRILDRWAAAGRREGQPARAAYFTMTRPVNFRTHVVDHLPADEQALVWSWADESPCEEILYPGCNVIAAPYLTRSRVFAGLNIRGSLELCCGEMFFRTGQFAMLEKTAARLTAWSRKLGFRRMLIPCTAGYNLFKNVLPRYGAQFAFEVEPLLPRVLQQFESGELTVAQPLNKTFAVQESCHAKFFDGYFDVPRRLLEKLGGRVIEEELCRERALCCGIGGGFAHGSGYHPWDITRATVRALHQAKKTGADALAVYCAGCEQMLAVGQIVYPTSLPIYHIFELVQLALGETPPRPHRRRAFTMFTGTARHQFPHLLSRRRFRPEEE